MQQKRKSCQNLTRIINFCQLYSIILLFASLASFAYLTNSKFAYAESGEIISATIQRLNNVRNNHGLDPLLVEYKLNTAARAHAKYMSRENRLTHIGKGSKTLQRRLRDVNFDFKRAGETLASNSSSNHDIIYQWLGSDRHREIILHSNYTHVGVGMARSDGTYYWVLIFASMSDKLMRQSK